MENGARSSRRDLPSGFFVKQFQHAGTNKAPRSTGQVISASPRRSGPPPRSPLQCLTPSLRVLRPVIGARNPALEPAQVVVAYSDQGRGHDLQLRHQGDHEVAQIMMPPRGSMPVSWHRAGAYTGTTIGSQPTTLPNMRIAVSLRRESRTAPGGRAPHGRGHSSSVIVAAQFPQLPLHQGSPPTTPAWQSPPADSRSAADGRCGRVAHLPSRHTTSRTSSAERRGREVPGSACEGGQVVVRAIHPTSGGAQP